MIIEANKKILDLNLRELIRYRELLWSLAWRDIRVKYAQTFIGFVWALINPLFSLIILHFVFGRVMQVDTGIVPHIVFTMIGLTVWTYFSTLVSDSGNSILNNQEMIKKIYFPKLVLPLSKAITGLIDFGVSFLLLIIVMLFYGIVPSSNIVYLPIFLGMVILLGLTAGIWISALTVRYRDFKFVVPFILQLGLYASPIAYSTDMVPDKYLFWYQLNPIVGILEGFRWSLIGHGQLELYVFYTIGLVIVFFILGLFYFKRVEDVMADII